MLTYYKYKKGAFCAINHQEAKFMLFNIAVVGTRELVQKTDVSRKEKERQITALWGYATTAEQREQVNGLEQMLQKQAN